jgi:hypothetical protein
MVRLEPVRRSLIFALALSLAGLGPVPLSACAFFSSKVAECATPKTESRCNEMNMDGSGARVSAAPDMSCCFVLKSPVLESQYKPSSLSLKGAPAVLGDLMGDTVRVQPALPALVAQDLSPPPLQSLLCTFLI